MHAPDFTRECQFLGKPKPTLVFAAHSPRLFGFGVARATRIHVLGLKVALEVLLHGPA